MDSEQRKRIEIKIANLYQKRELFLGAGDVEKFNAITREIATLDRELRELTTDRKE